MVILFYRPLINFDVDYEYENQNIIMFAKIRHYFLMKIHIHMYNKNYCGLPKCENKSKQKNQTTKSHFLKLKLEMLVEIDQSDNAACSS